MDISSPPLKWTVPFAQGDGSRVEIPATTADPARFSLTLGSPPLTGQPPETGGVPPQLEDFNGAFNQLARFVWWSIGGGPIPYDATWSSDSNVNGYAQGAAIRSADYFGTWLSLTNNNTVNPDTVGTNWVPLSAYGVTALTGQTGGTTTLTPAQAMRRVITVAGALTSNLTIVVPAWLYDWSITNLTTGAFTVTVKTPAGAGILIPQNSTPFATRSDGTNVISLNPAGRFIGVQVFSTAGSFTYTPTPGTNSVVVEVTGGGGAGGSVAATAAGQDAFAGGGGAGGYTRGRLTTGFSGATVVVGAGGTPGAAGANAGGPGGASSFAGTLSGPGGNGGTGAVSATPPTLRPGGSGALGSGGFVNGLGEKGGAGIVLTLTNGISGRGGRSTYGMGGDELSGNSNGAASPTRGAGGSGAAGVDGAVAAQGGAGGVGIVIVYEYT